MVKIVVITNREKDVSRDQETKRKVVREDSNTIEEKVVQLKRDAEVEEDSAEERDVVVTSKVRDAEETSKERDAEAAVEDPPTTKIVMKEEKRLRAAVEAEAASEVQEAAHVADTVAKGSSLPTLREE